MFGANVESNEFTLPLVLCVLCVLLSMPFSIKLSVDKSSHIRLMSSFKLSVIFLKKTCVFEYTIHMTICVGNFIIDLPPWTCFERMPKSMKIHFRYYFVYFSQRHFQYTWNECRNQWIYTSLLLCVFLPKPFSIKLPADKSSYICLMSSFKLSAIFIK